MAYNHSFLICCTFVYLIFFLKLLRNAECVLLHKFEVWFIILIADRFT
ncbi:hypothetical protein HanXRQr2_Chr04g0188461 [Helianthus annuus]|uniref:Uncharacterized protein n=1 Tax=Helianthus annuus TaxID=4232 RepID=A0A9K3JBZ4_HELAN|nr:hypothetical protein HanXRQr2_Chr04g0188461 [Helianthus annuus]